MSDAQALFDAAELERRREDDGEPLVPVRHSVVFPAEPRGTGETSSDRKKRLRSEEWTRFGSQVANAAHARLGLLSGRAFAEVMKCPWSRLEACTAACKCEGTGVVTVGFLVGHYHKLLAEIGQPIQKVRRGRGQALTRYHGSG